MRSIPPTAAVLNEHVSKLHLRLAEEVGRRWGSLPAASVVLVGRGKLELDAVDAVDTVHEQDQDEDKGDLVVL